MTNYEAPSHSILNITTNQVTHYFYENKIYLALRNYGYEIKINPINYVNKSHIPTL